VSRADNKALVRRFFQALDANDLESLGGQVAPDYRFHLAGNPDLTWDGHLQFQREFFKAFPDLEHTVEGQVAEGDLVVTRLAVRGTHRAELLGIPASGRRMDISAVAIHRIVRDTLAEYWLVGDTLSLFQQLGAIPSGRAGA
jgi:predicted ester cyclase